jgi:predicted nucleotide-binding protein (sugar kinase/HSP70/actin superfamily)
VIGAIGAALLACRKASQTGVGTRFRGYKIDQLDYALREFTCRGCPNLCGIREFSVQGEKTYWGDRCSDRFRRRPRSDRRPVIGDLFAYREELFTENGKGSPHGPRIGLPRGLYYYDYYPFWRAYLTGIGCDVVTSEPTSEKTVDQGIEATMAEPCFPIQVAHGHVRSLMERGTEYIFMPNVVSALAPSPGTAAFHCPWGQTLPFVLASAQGLAGVRDRILMPTIHFQDHPRKVQRELREVAGKLGISARRSDRAAQKAFETQRSVSTRLFQAGRQALRKLDDSGQMALVMVARPYTLHDRGSNMNLPGKLRQIYGINVIPMDCLELETTDVSSIHPNMFWNYGRRILQAAWVAGQHPNLHILFLTNYRCGPDSFIKHWVSRTSEKPFLTVQLDGHHNDAGVLTRCEAYLASKGFL